jgi:hypothetical protein
MHAIVELCASVDILIGFLSQRDDDKAFEAISIILLQTLDSFDRDSVATQQFLPVYDVIKASIDAMDLDGALRQAQIFRKQLEDLKNLVGAEHEPADSET